MHSHSYGNGSSPNGMLIVFGLAFGDEREKTHNVIEALKKSSSCDITFLDLNDNDFSQAELAAGVTGFFEKQHSQKTVIIAVHGAQAFPYGNHYSLVGQNDYSFLSDLIGGSSYFFLKGLITGNTIKSSLILQTIGDVAKSQGFDGNNLNVWQWSCQGAKLLEAAQTYLPKNTHYAAESKAFYQQEIFINTFIQTLSANKEFNFEELFISYHAMSHKMNFRNSIKEDEPFNIKIGNETAMNSVQKADKLVGQIQTGTIDAAALKSAVLKGCQLIQDADVKYPSFDNEAIQIDKSKCIEQTDFQIASIKHLKEYNFTSCIYTTDHRSYIETYLFDKDETINGCLLYNIASYHNEYTSEFIGGMEKFSLIAELYYNDL